MKYTLIVIPALLFLFFVSKVNSENIRFTMSGKQCVFPMKDNNGVTHTNCMIKEDGKEWCYIDHIGIAWDYCSRTDFKIFGQMLIKNIEVKDENNVNEFCLFALKNMGGKVFSINCNHLLTLKKLKSKVILTQNFLWYWLNGSQIKNSLQMCISPIETSIISENNNKIDYFGFNEMRKCHTDDEMSLGRKQKWRIDAGGRIQNLQNKNCLVRSDKEKILIDLIRDITRDNIEIKNDELTKLKAYEVFLGDCIGNSFGYQGRENWILIEYKEDTEATMMLQKLSKNYNKGKEEVNKILEKSTNEIIKLIKLRSSYIEQRQLLENSETNLDNLEKTINNFVLGEELEQFHPNFVHNGVLLEIYRYDNFAKNNVILERKMLLESPEISGDTVSSLNIIKEFNQESGAHVLNLNLSNKLMKLSGFIIGNEQEEFQFRIETNTYYQLRVNGRIHSEKLQLETNYGKEENSIYYTDKVFINPKTLNSFEVLIFSKADTKTNFKFTKLSKKKELLGLKKTDFIPFTPYKKTCFNYKDLCDSSHILTCKTTQKQIANEIKEDSEVFFCPTNCKAEEKITSVCSDAIRTGAITDKGGQFLISKTKNKDKTLTYSSLDYSLVGMFKLITDVNRGYLEDLSKNSEEENRLLQRNYIVKLNKENLNYETNLDSSFVFYKKEVVGKDDYVLIDVKLSCDDQSNTFKNPFLIDDEKEHMFKIEKLHDMINGYTLWTKKIKFSDLMRVQDSNEVSFVYVDDLNIKFIKLKDEKPILPKEKMEKIVNNLSSNKFICKLPKHLVILKVIYKKRIDVIDLPDLHAECSETFDSLKSKMAKMGNKRSIALRCMSCDLNESYKDIKSFNNKIGFKEKIEMKDLVCKTAMKRELITINGGVFRLDQTRNSSFHLGQIYGRPCMTVVSKNYKVYGGSKFFEKAVTTKNLIDDNFKALFVSIQKDRFIKKNIRKSSFLETDSSTKFFSNDLLMKLEKGLDDVTTKIADGSKKISEVRKVNTQLQEKIEKIEKGDGSIEVIQNRVNEIKKHEMTLETKVNEKFSKYKKILTEKDSKLLDIENSQYLQAQSKKSYSLNSSVFNDWIIIDSTDAIEGPSNWNYKELDKFLYHNSLIYVTDESHLASTMILPSLQVKNMRADFSFTSSTSGYINILFKYIDYRDFLGLELYRSENKGHIKLRKMMNGKILELKSLECTVIKTIFKDCVGYSLEAKNTIKILTFKRNLAVLLNNVEILKYTENDLDQENYSNAKFAFSISGQNNFLVDDINLSELGIEDYVTFQSLLTGTSIGTKVEKESPPMVKFKEIPNVPKESKENKTKEITSLTSGLKKGNKLKYNKLTNKFEDEEGLQNDATKGENKEKEISSEDKLVEEDVLKVTKICLESKYPKYMCTFLTNVLKKNKISIRIKANFTKIINIIATDCSRQMKNNLICKEIITRLSPVLKKSQESLIDMSSSNAQNNNLRKKSSVETDIDFLLSMCSMKNYKGKRNRTVCINPSIAAELSTRVDNADDKCKQEFCRICCQINYGNEACKLCRI